MKMNVTQTDSLTDEEIAIIATFGGLSFFAISGPMVYFVWNRFRSSDNGIKFNVIP